MGAYVEATNNCCAVGEVAGLRYDKTPEESLLGIATGFFDPDEQHVDDIGRWAHIIFTEVTRAEEEKNPSREKKSYSGTYGRELAALIKKLKLGTVIASRTAMNPNHSEKGYRHFVKTYVWTVNRKNFLKWAKEQGVKTKQTSGGYDFYAPDPGYW
jgi:hypothetical protein